MRVLRPGVVVVLAVCVLVGSGGGSQFPFQEPGHRSAVPNSGVSALERASSSGPAIASYAIYQFGLRITTVAVYLHVAVQGLNLSDVATPGATAAFGLRWDPVQVSLIRNTTSNVTADVGLSAFIPPGSEIVRFAIAETGWTTLELYAENVQPFTFLESVNFTNGGSISLNASLLESPGPVSIVKDTLHGTAPHQVYAYYYAWYGSISAWLNGSNGPSSPSVAGEPLLGYYASHNVSIIDAQIRQAQQSGITAFLESWGQNQSYVNQSLQIVVPEAERLGFHIGINYETLAALINPGLTYAQALSRFVNSVDWYLTTYGDSPATLTLNGTPLVFVWSAAAFPAAFWQQAFAEVRLVHMAYFIAETSSNYSAFDVFDGVDEYSVDFALVESALSAHFTGAGLTQGTTQNYWFMQLEASLHNKLWFAPTEPGFDNQNDLSEAPQYVPRQSGAFYTATWDLADQGRADGITITSWNEWYEGSNVEPAAWFLEPWSAPYQYLDITTCEVGRYLAGNFSGPDSCAGYDPSSPTSPLGGVISPLIVWAIAASVGAALGLLSISRSRPSTGPNGRSSLRRKPADEAKHSVRFRR